MRSSPDGRPSGAHLHGAAELPRMRAGRKEGRGDPVFVVLTVWGYENGKGRDHVYWREIRVRRGLGAPRCAENRAGRGNRTSPPWSWPGVRQQGSLRG